MAKANSGFTPQAVRDRWSNFKSFAESLLDSYAEHLPSRLTLIFVLIAVNYALCFGSFLPDNAENFIHLTTFRTFFLSLCVWGPAGLVLQRVEHRGFFMPALLSAHILAVVFFFGHNAPLADKILQILVMILQPVLAYALCALCATLPVWTAWITSLSIAAFSYWIFCFASPISSLAWVSLRANPTRYVMFLTYFALQFHFLRTRFTDRGSKLSYVFNPVQTLFPLPLPAEPFQRKASPRTLSQALLNIIFATCACALFLALHSLAGRFSGLAAVIFGSALQFFYLYYLIAFSIGLLQWCGFSMPQPCDFALISASPHMRWRRWNRYTYKWLSLAIFYPLLKTSGNRLLALMGAFLCVTLLHVNALIFVPPAALAQTDVKNFALRILVYYLGHAVAIWAGFYFPLSWSDENRRSSWLGVILTWAMVTCIFSFYY